MDGNDVEAVYTVASQAVQRARAGEGPSLIEALTYRHRGHSRTDPGRYRPSEEVAEWLERDPVTSFARRLENAGWTLDELARIEEAVVAEVEEAVERALASPPPGPEELFTDVFCRSDTSWRN